MASSGEFKMLLIVSTISWPFWLLLYIDPSASKSSTTSTESLTSTSEYVGESFEIFNSSVLTLSALSEKNILRN
jgi:hypothetical protein